MIIIMPLNNNINKIIVFFKKKNKTKRTRKTEKIMSIYMQGKQNRKLYIF